MFPPYPVTKREIALAFAAFVIINLISAFTQRQNTYQGGLAWEGPYYTVATQIARGEPIAAEGPYVFRIGTPWLAAKVSPRDLFRGFRIVNATANAITTVLLLFWLRYFDRDWRVRLLMVLLFLAQWDAPTRLLYHSPVHVDAWFFVCLVGGLIATERYLAAPSTIRLVAIAAFTCAGVAFREVAMLVPLALLGARNPIVFPSEDAPRWTWRAPPWREALPFVAGLGVFGLIRFIVRQTDSYSFLETVIDFLYTKTAVHYLHAWLLAFGPVLFIIIYQWRASGRFLLKNQRFAFFLVGAAALGFIGGTDTERLLYWSMPGVYVLLGRAIEGSGRALASRWLVGLLAVGQVMTTRILWTTPDYPNDAAHTFPILQQFGSHVPFLDLFSYHGFRMKEMLSFVQFVIFGALVLWWMHRRTRGTRNDEGKQGLGASFARSSG